MAESPKAPIPTPSSITRLPPELIHHILDHVPPRSLQRTALSLLSVFHDYPISARYLFLHLVVYRSQQLTPLWKRLKIESGKGDLGLHKAVRTFSLESWQGDADILNNALRLLPDIRVLLLNIGTNFAPEHLEEMFEDPRSAVRRMEMRFRPYVEQASYYQFLKGSYFDTAIETLYRKWPEMPAFSHLSIVQDLPPRIERTAPTTPAPSTVASTTASLANSISDLTIETPMSDSDRASGRSTPPTSVSSGSPVESKGYTGHGPFPYISEKMNYSKPKTFAQPIVFFDIKCLARFGSAPVARNLTHLRLRVPSRDLAYVLVLSPTLFPSLRYLDISTTNVRLDSVLSSLLRNYSRLEHLVLDRVNLFGFTAKDKGLELSKDLGGMCVSAGLARGKERERQLTAWEIRERTRIAQAEVERRRAQAQTQTQGRPGNSDESGDDDEEGEDEEQLAAAREMAAATAERQRQIELARARRGHRSAAQSTFSLRDRSVRNRGLIASTSSTVNTIPLPPSDKLYMVLPPLPNLRSISIGGEAHNLSSAKVQEWENEFHAGWRDGLSKVYGWAQHVADKYERAIKRAEEWRAHEIGTAQSQVKPTTGKGKSKAPPKPIGTKPPMEIKLFRFPTPDEYGSIPLDNTADPTIGLVEIIDPENRSYLEPYKVAIAEAELHRDNHALPEPCVFCTVPDCEGPQRRGAEGERVDGRGGLGGRHRKGCGHLVGRGIWGWEGV